MRHFKKAHFSDAPNSPKYFAKLEFFQRRQAQFFATLDRIEALLLYSSQQAHRHAVADVLAEWLSQACREEEAAGNVSSTPKVTCLHGTLRAEAAA